MEPISSEQSHPHFSDNFSVLVIASSAEPSQKTLTVYSNPPDESRPQRVRTLFDKLIFLNIWAHVSTHSCYLLHNCSPLNTTPPGLDSLLRKRRSHHRSTWRLSGGKKQPPFLVASAALLSIAFLTPFTRNVDTFTHSSPVTIYPAQTPGSMARRESLDITPPQSQGTSHTLIYSLCTLGGTGESLWEMNRYNRGVFTSTKTGAALKHSFRCF